MRRLFPFLLCVLGLDPRAFRVERWERSDVTVLVYRVLQLGPGKSSVTRGTTLRPGGAE